MKEKMFKLMVERYYYYYDKAIKVLTAENENSKRKIDNNPNDYVYSAVVNAESVIDRFNELNEFAKRNEIDEQKIYKDFFNSGDIIIHFDDLYNYEDIVPYKYIEIYTVYRLLTCIMSFFDINSKHVKRGFDRIYSYYKNAITKWKEKYPEKINDFNYISLCITEELFELFAKLNSQLKTEYILAKVDIECDMKLKNPLFTYPDYERYVYSYMFYYLLPIYVNKTQNNRFFENYRNTMLEELTPFVDNITKETIVNVANEYIEDKKAKKKVAKV